MGFIFSGMTGGLLCSPFVSGVVYAKAGYFPIYAMVIAVLVADLSLRFLVIEKGTAALWDEPEAPHIPQSTERGVQKGLQPPRKHQATSCRDTFANHENSQKPLGPDSEECSSILRIFLRQSTDPQPDALSYSHRVAGSLPSRSWFTRRFPSTAVILGSRRLMTAVFGVFVYTTITSSFDGILAQFVKRTFNFDSFGAGIIFLAFSTPALFGTVYGALSDRYGPRKLALVGFIIAALGLALSVLITQDSEAQKAGLSIVLIIIGQKGCVWVDVIWMLTLCRNWS